MEKVKKDIKGLPDDPREAYALGRRDREAEIITALTISDVKLPDTKANSKKLCSFYIKDTVCYWIRPNRFEQRTCGIAPCKAQDR